MHEETRAIPEIAAINEAIAKVPSPSIAPYPIILESVNLLICFDVVPDETSPWKPLIAPQATVTKSIGKIDGA